MTVSDIGSNHFQALDFRNYVERAPNGLSILSEPVCRFYPMELERRVNSGEISPPSSLTELMAGTAEMKLSEVIYEALSRHAECNIDFVEWGAGYQLDEQMSPEGFHVTAGAFSFLLLFPLERKGLTP